MKADLGTPPAPSADCVERPDVEVCSQEARGPSALRTGRVLTQLHVALAAGTDVGSLWRSLNPSLSLGDRFLV